MASPINVGLTLLTLGAGLALKHTTRKRDDALLQRFFDKGVALSYPVARTSTTLDVESVVDTPGKKKKTVQEDGLGKLASAGILNVGAAMADLTYKLMIPAVTAMVGMAFVDYSDRVRKNTKLRKHNKVLADELDKNLRVAWELVRYRKKMEKGELEDAAIERSER